MLKSPGFNFAGVIPHICKNSHESTWFQGYKVHSFELGYRVHGFEGTVSGFEITVYIDLRVGYIVSHYRLGL